MTISPASMLSKYIQIMQFNIHKALIINKLKNHSSLFLGTWIDIGAGDQPYKKYFNQSEKILTTNTRRHYSKKEQDVLESSTDFWIEDGTSLPLINDSVDGIACIQVLSVISNPDLFFKEANRVLKSGGKLLITTDFLYPTWSKEDMMRHSANNLTRLAVENGFEIDHIESFGGFGSTLYALISRYVRSFPGIWKSKGFLSKIITAIIYLIILLFMPFISLKGFFIFLFEKKITTNFEFTFNLWAVARKVK